MKPLTMKRRLICFSVFQALCRKRCSGASDLSVITKKDLCGVTKKKCCEKLCPTWNTLEKYDGEINNRRVI